MDGVGLAVFDADVIVPNGAVVSELSEDPLTKDANAEVVSEDEVKAEAVSGHDVAWFGSIAYVALPMIRVPVLVTANGHHSVGLTLLAAVDVERLASELVSWLVARAEVINGGGVEFLKTVATSV
ncbi:hypothetical protein H2198_006756 [Neophaeococcomyces mojaviensis]|uniref:Uncharacterized protein n=1 Tax=Neophaeococcomyces mojaviensis TaxID=3383035 RepID=A0ACC3A2D7_9EURO|nr:hypothetical protein H2198_006756 [Knufia sp. JES_112]